MIKQCIVLLLLLLMAAPVMAAEPEWHGPDDILALLRPYLVDDAAGSRRVEAQLSEILATEGYFSPRFERMQSLGEDASAGTSASRVQIVPGPRTTIRQVEIVIEGAIDPHRKQGLIEAWTLPVGQAFRQAAWNEAKQQLLARLLAEDYADARLIDSAADVDAQAHAADLRVHYEAGPRYRFGRLKVEGLQRYEVALIERYNRDTRAMEGQPYREDALNALQANLQATPYFSSVQVLLDRENAVSVGEGLMQAPILIRVREQVAHRITVGAGASSNTGARVELGYHTPNFVNNAWELGSGLRLEQKKQTAYADIFMPPDGRDRRHGLGVMTEISDIQGLRTDRYALGVQSLQQRGSIEQRLSLNWQSERLEPDGVESVVSRALVPNVMWTWRHVDSLLEPRHGSVIQGQVGGGAKLMLSDQNFIRLYGRLQHYRPLGPRDTLMLRFEAGATLAPSRDHIPQDYLFRAGGAGSVRGYAYQSLGVTEGSAIVGGRYLGILSAEVTHWLTDAWGAAAFIDAGDAYDSLHDIRWALGYGLGARWRSPAGPIGVDLAYGERVHSMQLHFSLSIPF